MRLNVSEAASMSETFREYVVIVIFFVYSTFE